MTHLEAPPEPVLNAALRLLAKRQRGMEELRGRLLKKGFPPAPVDETLRWLEERDLLDDQAFSEALARDRLRFSPRSPAVLERELKRRGIAPAVAQGAVSRVMKEAGASEVGLAQEAARRWARAQGRRTRADLTAEPFTRERDRARRRLHGFLSRRGFTGATARAGLEAAIAEARILNDDLD